MTQQQAHPTGEAAQSPASGFQRLLQAQREIGPGIEKSKTNPHFKSGYVPLDAVLKIVVPALQKLDLLLVQGQQDLGREGVVGVVTQIIDVLTGNVLISSCFPVPLVDNNPQKATAAVTYGRRTGVTSVMSIAETDDDGTYASLKEGKSRPGAGAKTESSPNDGWG